MTEPIKTIREEFVHFARNVHGADAGLLADHAFEREATNHKPTPDLGSPEDER